VTISIISTARVTPSRLAKRLCVGFTLVEMLTTMVVLAVVLAVVAPGLGSFISANRLGASQSELLSALALARSEATKRGKRVVVAATAPVSGAEFSGGWKVFVDEDQDGALSAGDTTVRDYPATAGAVKIKTAGGETAVTFTPRGYLAPLARMQFTVCGKAGVSKGYDILLEPLGLTDVQEMTSCP
jgi:type IV fimbrial biogenesis protein FimT